MSSGEITDEQEAELISLRREMQKNKQERAEHIAAVKAQIEELQLTVADLFSGAEIAKAAVGAPKGVRKAPRAMSPRNGRPSDANEVLIVLNKAEGEKGPSVWEYRQGRVFERAGGTTSKPWVPKLKQFPSKLLKTGCSADSLRPHFTAAGEAYFATEQGQAELAKLVEATVEAREQLKVG